MSIEQRLELRCHPSNRDGAVRGIVVSVRRSADGELRLAYRLDGDISRLKFDAACAPPRIGKELWRHTCFEAFILVVGQPEYHEFNFATSHAWTLYSFSGYRNGGPVGNESMRPQIAARSTDTRLELDAVVRLDRLSEVHSTALLRVGLAAVVESADGLSYWALAHPSDKPDFHDAGGFALLLEPPCARW